MYATRGTKGFVDRLFEKTDGKLYGFSYTEFMDRINNIAEDEFINILSKYVDTKSVDIINMHVLKEITFKDIGKNLGMTMAYASKKFADAIDKIRDSEVILSTIMYGMKYIPNNTMKTPVNLLGLSGKTVSALHKFNIFYVEDITSLNAIASLLDGKSFGETCLKDLLNTLSRHGYGITKIN